MTAEDKSLPQAFESIFCLIQMRGAFYQGIQDLQEMTSFTKS